MRCLHPHCPMGHGLPSWQDVVDHPDTKVSAAQKPSLLAALNADFGHPPSNPPVVAAPPTTIQALRKRLMRACPCLFNQIAGVAATARAVAHLCEITLGTRITSANVHQAFLIQHPNHPSFAAPPVIPCTDGGAVMEMLCSEALESAGVVQMPLDASGWPRWTMPGHILLNEGGMNALRAFGDILIPCAPTNLVISVKSETARERLLYSSNSIEGVGFGFFTQADEFWTKERMGLYKRMGFSAIYMPNATYLAVLAHLNAHGVANHAVNVNGTALYRPLQDFGADMARIVGKSALDL